jgi:pimeloyl-ACP methyl ester carboxylesterase
MQFIKKDGVILAYEDINSGLPAILLVHGWGCDHTSLAAQAEFFSRSHRVVSVDLRGHGASDAPHQDYTMAAFADDLAWLCAKLGLTKPAVIGHSMGGNVVLEFAARYPDLPASIVLLDTVMLVPQPFLEPLRPLAQALKGPEYLSVVRQLWEPLFLATDDPARKEQIIAFVRSPQHVLASSFPNHITEYDASSAAAGCHVPIAYIGAQIPLVDMDRFRSLCPHLITAQTLGSGHFAPMLVPDQINAMLARFLAIYPSGSKTVACNNRQ